MPSIQSAANSTDTLQFLKTVLPTQGLYIATLKRPDGRTQQSMHSSLQALTKVLHGLDQRNYGDVYFACASFAERRIKGKRKADNAAFIKSQWIDVDVGDGPGKHSTDREAATAVVKMCKDLKLPKPTIVKSGRGLHCYWTFTQDVPADQARPWMAGFAAGIREYGLLHDRSRTKDIASILRPVGTHWRKDGERPVKVMCWGDPVDPEAFYTPFAHLALDEPCGAPAADPDDEWGTGPKEYPESHIKPIISKCRVMAGIARTKGNVEEPLWRTMLGLVKHTVNGDKYAHVLSKGHPEYNPQETREKLAGWEAGPATCGQFEASGGDCSKCPHRGKIKSPIHLGYVEPEQTIPSEPITPTVTTPPAITDYSEKLPQNIPFWPSNYKWKNGLLLGFVRDASNQGEEDDGSSKAGIWTPLFKNLVYPYMRYKDINGEMWVKVCALESSKTNKWKKFEIPAKAMADSKTFATTLGTHEVYTVSTNNVQARQFFKDVIGQMQDIGLEAQAYNQFGWHDGKFVMGTAAIGSSSTDPVFLGDKIPSDLNKPFGEKGTIKGWVDLIDHIYNRKGAEPYQFMICAAFGAPLISLADSDLWHGIPIALTGEGGIGKTTTCLAACSMYGSPDNFFISTNEMGSTMNALLTRVGVMRHLPLVLDEMTGRTTQDVQGMLYALSNGRPKERNRSDGSLIDGNSTWDTFTFITGNMNITSMLSQLDRHRSEATQLRCFEISLDDSFNTKVFGQINAKDVIENQLLANNHGLAGKRYLAYVAKNKDKIAKALIKTRSKLSPEGREETRERFYMDAIATAIVGGNIAKRLGLINFDMNAILGWAKRHVATLRTTRANNISTVHDMLGQFLSSLHGRTVVTDSIGDGRRGMVFEVDPREVRNPVARIARGDERFLVSMRYMTDWCAENNVNAKWFRDQLLSSGYLIAQAGDPTPGLVKMNLFKGTSVPSAQIRCLEFDYSSVMGSDTGPTFGVIQGGLT